MLAPRNLDPRTLGDRLSNPITGFSHRKGRRALLFPLPQGLILRLQALRFVWESSARAEKLGRAIKGREGRGEGGEKRRFASPPAPPFPASLLPCSSFPARGQASQGCRCRAPTIPTRLKNTHQRHNDGLSQFRKNIQNCVRELVPVHLGFLIKYTYYVSCTS